MRRIKTKKRPLFRKSKGSRKSKRLSTGAGIRLQPIELAFQESEIRYRRLFETAQDGILILSADKGIITDVNPFLMKLLGRSRAQFLGKKLWEIGLFQDVEKSKSAFRTLQREGYIRYEDLPLETRDGRYIDVEFVSNVYVANKVRVIQCNIRDITARKHAEVEKAILETVEAEQRRIGQDLHDGLCQELTGIALIAKVLAQKLSVGLPEESANASEIAELINRAIDQTRHLARGLSPVEIEVEGLTHALLQFCHTIERFYKISCVFICEEDIKRPVRYPPLLANHLYRIVQEGVSNAIQHGKAKRVVITLAAVQGRGLLTIQDDGCGFQTQDEEKSGLGLRSMRYRGRIIGARFKICQDAAGGTVVTCSFPQEPEMDIKKE